MDQSICKDLPAFLLPKRFTRFVFFLGTSVTCLFLIDSLWVVTKPKIFKLVISFLFFPLCSLSKYINNSEYT